MLDEQVALWPVVECVCEAPRVTEICPLEETLDSEFSGLHSKVSSECQVTMNPSPRTRADWSAMLLAKKAKRMIHAEHVLQTPPLDGLAEPRQVHLSAIRVLAMVVRSLRTRPVPAW